MSARLRVALALLRAEKRGLEASINVERFDAAVSRRLDALTIAVEALEALREREEPAA
ncbi:MAG: hypothetical protein HYY95_00685 [Candidatus Rokubacteria bacterium]|nr:hypothetical protein [Candidatus Rokubacteria bacterium]